MNTISLLSCNFTLTCFYNRDNRGSVVKYFHALNSNWRWPYEKLFIIQLQALRKIVVYAYNIAEYSDKIIDERGIEPKSIESIDDLEMLPIPIIRTICNSIKMLRIVKLEAVRSLTRE